MLLNIWCVDAKLVLRGISIYLVQLVHLLNSSVWLVLLSGKVFNLILTFRRG